MILKNPVPRMAKERKRVTTDSEKAQSNFCPNVPLRLHVVKEALRPVEDKVELAFVFGSFASGDYGNDSDIDLFVVSDLAGVKLAELLGPVQNEISRAINTSQFTPTEYKQRRRRRDHFLTRVFDGPRIMIIGDIDES